MRTAIGIHALSSIGEFLIWRSIPNSPNRALYGIRFCCQLTNFLLELHSPLGVVVPVKELLFLYELSALSVS